jgi:hypothetical protein
MVRFGYLDFASPVVVTVFGVDDDVDQGDSYQDVMVVVVTSSDSWFECDDQLRPACNQAVSYNGFNVTDYSAAVTVLDNDEAGLVVVLASTNEDDAGDGGGDGGWTLNATCDNRGDPLAPALLMLSLATKPLAEVIVRVSLNEASGFTAMQVVTLTSSSLTLSEYTTLTTQEVPSSLLGPLPLSGAQAEEAVSAVVTFGPTNWSSAVAVAVWGAAASPNRPVCANASRFCPSLADRRTSESVTVTASSLADETYNSKPSSFSSFYPSLAPSVSSSSSTSITSTPSPTPTPPWLPALPPLNFAVDVVRDAADPPKVVGAAAAFNNALSGLVVTFESSSDRAGLSGSFACEEILGTTSLASSSSEVLFGLGYSCAFDASGTFLRVTFGAQATVVPGDVFTLLPDLVRSSTLPNSLTSLAQTLVVGGPPSSFSMPPASLAATSSNVGLCDDLGLDASGSGGSGGRRMTFTWSASSTTAMASAEGGNGLLSNISSVLETANDAPGGGFNSQHRVTLPFHAMPLSLSSFTVSLTVTNFLGLEQSASVEVSKLSFPAPVVAISPSSLVHSGVTHSTALKLSAVAQLPKLACMPSLSGERKKLVPTLLIV